MSEIQAHARARYHRMGPEVDAAKELLGAGNLSAYITRCKALAQDAPVAMLYSQLACAYLRKGSMAEAVRIHFTCLLQDPKARLFLIVGGYMPMLKHALTEPRQPDNHALKHYTQPVMATLECLVPEA